MLAEHEIAEGTVVQVSEPASSPDEIAALVDGKRVMLSMAAAQLIWVEVAA